MKKHVPLILSILLLFVFACNPPAKETEKEVEPEKVNGEQLEKELWSDFKSMKMDTITKKIADAFQSVHGDGTRNKQEEIELLNNLDLGNYQLTDFTVTRQDNIIVVTYMVSVEETIKGETLSTKPSPRMSVWIKSEQGWQWIAHANLNPMKNK